MTTPRSVAVITAAALILALPLILLGYPREAHDSIEHVPWATHFARVFWSGTFYPRWMPDMNGGLGSPIFFYYPPGPYWLSVLFDFGPDRVLSGGFQLRIAMPLVLILSGLTCFVFLRRLVDRTTATAGAVIYTAMPYHLIEIYQRGDIPEFSSFIFVPLVLAGLDQAFRRPLSGLAITATSYAGLIFCHPLAALVSSPLFAAYALFRFAQQRSWAGLGASAGGAVLGLALSAVFLMPALLMHDYVFNQPKFMLVSYLFAGPTQNETFIYPVWAVFVFSVAVLAIVYFFRKNISQRRELAFWLVAGAVYCFFLSRLSWPFWYYVKATQLMHFPFRINVAVVMILTVCVTLWIARFSFQRKKAVLAVFMLIALVIPAEPIIGNDFQGRPGKWAELARCSGWQLYRPVTAPRWKCGAPVSPLARAPSERAWLAEGRVEVTRWASRDIQLNVQSAKPQTLYIAQFHFPGWKAVLDDGRILTATANSTDGIIAVAVPEGHFGLSATLEALPPEQWGWRISWAALALVLGIAGVDFALRRKFFGGVGRKMMWPPGAQPS